MAVAERQSFLVTAANGDLAEAVGGVLRDAFPDASIHGTEMDRPWPGLMTFETVGKVPRADDSRYPDALAELADRLGTTCVIPCHDRELFRLAEDPGAADALPLLMPPSRLVRTFVDKLHTAKWLSDNGIASPFSLPLSEARADMLPLIAKPRRGSGAQGVQLIRDPAHLEGLRAAFGDSYVGQEFLEDDASEHTCTVLRLHGELRTLALCRRLDAGRTVEATVVADGRIEELLRQIASAADLAGVLNVQLRIRDGEPVPFEINPRFSSTVKMRHMIGFSDLVWAVNARSGARPPEFEAPVGATIYRLSREIVKFPEA